MNRVMSLFALLVAFASPSKASDAPQPAITAGDPAQGQVLAERCASCHALHPDDRDRWGPSLVGIVDRPVGAETGYRYGRYLREQAAQGAVWDEARLQVWLVDSKAVAKQAGTRTKMPAQQLTPQEITDLVLYLRTLE